MRVLSLSVVRIAKRNENVIVVAGGTSAIECHLNNVIEQAHPSTRLVNCCWLMLHNLFNILPPPADLKHTEVESPCASLFSQFSLQFARALVELIRYTLVDKILREVNKKCVLRQL